MTLLLANFDALADYLSHPNTIVGLILTILGLAFVMLSKRITKAVRKSQAIEPNDKVYIGLLAFGLVMILAGFIIAIIR